MIRYGVSHQRVAPRVCRDRRLREWLVQSQPIGISAVGWAEFLCGPVDVHDGEPAARVVDEPVALLALDAAMAAELFDLAGRRRGSLNNCMIVATALRPAADSAAVPVMGKGKPMRRGTKPARAKGPVARTSAEHEAGNDFQLEQRLAEALESRTQFQFQ